MITRLSIQHIIISLCIILLFFIIISKFKFRSIFELFTADEEMPDDISVPSDIGEEDIGNFDKETAENQAAVDKEMAEGEAIMNNTPDPTTSREVVQAESDIDASMNNEEKEKELQDFDKNVADDCPDCVKHTRRDRANEETLKEPRERTVKASLM